MLKNWVHVADTVTSAELTLVAFSLYHTSMASRAIHSDFAEMLKSGNREIETTHDTFRDGRVNFYRQPFMKELYASCSR